MAAFASSINSVFQSEEIEAHLRPGLGIANGVSPMVRHEFAQFNHDIPKFASTTNPYVRPTCPSRPTGLSPRRNHAISFGATFVVEYPC